MTIEAKIICDSVNPTGSRLTTFVCRYPRFIHAELLTHRSLSRNSSSSRAIPVEKMIKQVQEEPAMPVHWGANRPGMQAKDQLAGDELLKVQTEWMMARDSAVQHAKFMVAMGLHKQVANRILEPFMHITTIISATEFANFFSLRCHPDAQPEFQELASKMADVYRSNEPDKLDDYDWHLPFIASHERAIFVISDLVKMSVARCARVSYLNHDGTIPNHDKDVELHNRLVVQKPLHSSPAEHQAHPLNSADRDTGNFKGWLQYRKILAGECMQTFPWEVTA